MRNISSILQIQPGTLIGGFFVDTEYGNLYLNSEWEYNGTPEYKKQFELELGYRVHVFEDRLVQREIETGRLFKSENDSVIKLQKLAKNSSRYSSFFFNRKSLNIDKGTVVGMSLGESIILTNCHISGEIYRPKIYNIYLLHKMLIGDMVYWIQLESKGGMGSVSFLEIDSLETARKVNMGIVW